MQLQHAVKSVFVQLDESLLHLTDEQYTRPSRTLFNASIGQHVRHIIELFLCLEKGYESGLVNYEKRERNLAIETDKSFARELMKKISGSLGKLNKGLLLEGNYDEQTEDGVTVTTNYYREIIYNLEHTVHHMALIRIGINEVSPVIVPDNFGVASSTLRYRKHVHG